MVLFKHLISISYNLSRWLRVVLFAWKVLSERLAVKSNLYPPIPILTSQTALVYVLITIRVVTLNLTVTVVLPSRTPPQVLNSVVRGIAVSMIHTWFVTWIRYEQQGNRSML